MRYLFKIYCLWLVCLYTGSTVVWAQSSESSTQYATQKDGTRVRVLWRSNTDNAKALVRVEMAKPQHTSFVPVRLNTQLIQAIDTGELASVVFKDLNQDGNYDLIVRDWCSTVNCGESWYLWNAKRRSFEYFFSGSGVNISIKHQHVLESGRASCCSWEYHAYPITQNKGQWHAADDMAFMIKVDVQIERDFSAKHAAKHAIDTEMALCRFYDRHDKMMVRPQKVWLKECLVYEIPTYYVTPAGRRYALPMKTD